MRKSIRIFSVLLTLISLLNLSLISVTAAPKPFELVSSQTIESLGGIMYYYKHAKTGAEVIYLNNGSEKREFSIGFKTPPNDSKGANHVLEHCLLCGSEKYPTKNIMHYIQGGALAEMINAVTADDCTYYLVKTPNETEYYNLMDVYMNGIFHPLLLSDENIFRQQGIRLEYSDGKVQYNGVVYNELRIKSFDTLENSVSFLADKLYTAIYGNTAPSFNSGGSLEELKQLTYADLLRVYNTYYVPSNSMTYLSGKQDIDKTLDILDNFFKNFEKENITIEFEDTKQQPEELISEYNINSDTKNVDIGFMSSGVLMSADVRELYARDIIFNIIMEKMNDLNAKNYVSGGNSGGISNLALLCSEVPADKKDEMISAYNDILKSFDENGFDYAEFDKKIAEYIENKNPYVEGTDSNVFNGIMYHNDPFYYTDSSAVIVYLTEHKEYFDTVLKKYFTENPYSKIVVSGNGTAAIKDNAPTLGAEELDEVKKATEEFNRWADKPDDPSVVEAIPSLTLDEVKDAPEITSPIHELYDGMDFYYTNKDGDYAGVFLPLNIPIEDLDFASLMYFFLNDRLKNSGIDNVYFALLPMENREGQINPQFMIGIHDSERAEILKNVAEFLQSDELWEESALSEYIKSAPEDILKNSYRDPYYLSYELKQSALSGGSSFYSFTIGAIQEGSPRYYHFLKKFDSENTSELLEKLKQLTSSVMSGTPSVEYMGNGYDEFKTAISEIFTDNAAIQTSKWTLPPGCNSAAVITPLEDANHFMITGCYDSGEYSGKLEVLGNVLTTNYALPILRGKHGAYGARIRFYERSMVVSTAGLSDVDLFLELMQGMGDYLRNLNITQKELDAVIIPAVKEYDEYYSNDFEYGAQAAMYGKTAADFYRTRNEMLSVTVEDLRNYANFVDSLVAQNRVFAVLGKSAADNAEFPFAYYADADTLEIIPRLKKGPSAYINGKTDTLFAPDDCITRAEAAALISRLMIDERQPKNQNIFKDISPNDWYYNPVLSVFEKNIMSGYDNNTFMPDKNITRAELAAVLSKFIFNGNTELKQQYDDISKEAWFYTSIAKIINSGILRGYEDGTLRPENTVTRAEAVAMINRMLGISLATNTKSPFKDVTASHWAYNDITAAAK